MTVAEYREPNFTIQDATTYKAAIDNAVRVLAEAAAQFAPHETSPRSMAVAFESGRLPNGDDYGEQTVSGIGTPSTDDRIDRFYLNMNAQQIVRLTGTEAASPTPPAYPGGVLPLAQLYLTPSHVEVANDDLIDERPFGPPSLVEASGGYTKLFDPDQLFRFFIGRSGVDNRIIFKMHTTDSGSSVEFQDNGGSKVFAINGDGVPQTGSSPGVSGSFTTNDGKTVTVTNGLITSIV